MSLGDTPAPGAHTACAGAGASGIFGLLLPTWNLLLVDMLGKGHRALASSQNMLLKLKTVPMAGDWMPEGVSNLSDALIWNLASAGRRNAGTAHPGKIPSPLARERGSPVFPAAPNTSERARTIIQVVNLPMFFLH